MYNYKTATRELNFMAYFTLLKIITPIHIQWKKKHSHTPSHSDVGILPSLRTLFLNL